MNCHKCGKRGLECADWVTCKECYTDLHESHSKLTHILLALLEVIDYLKGRLTIK